MSGRKLTVDWKHTAEELYAHYNNTPNTQIARRFQALALLRRGRTLKETAAIVGVSIRTVQKWLTWYRTGGLDELTRRTRGGNRIPVRPLADPRPAGTGTALPARRYAGLSHAPRGSRVVSRDTGRGAVGASGATALPSAGVSAQDTASDGGACGRCATGAVEKRGFREALTAQGVRLGQRVVFVDELRVGLIGQVRRRWTVRGVRLCQRVERSYEWRYLQVAVDPLSGEVWWRWSGAFGEGGGSGGVVGMACVGGRGRGVG
jgi:hypothetical protein